MSFLESIGSLTLVAVPLLLAVAVHERRRLRIIQCQELLKEDWDTCKEFEKFRQSLADADLSHEQALLKFFTKERRESTWRKVEEQKQKKSEYDDMRKRKYMVARALAYRYDDFIFSIFAPFATKYPASKADGGCRWYYQSGDSTLTKDDILALIECEPKFELESAEELFRTWVHTELIEVNESSRHAKGNPAKERSESEWTYDLGNTLSRYADIICESDLTLDKWIKAHAADCGKS